MAKEGMGALFRNNRKERNNQPDYTGSLVVDGVRRRIVAWIAEGKNGKYMKLQLGEAFDDKAKEKPAPSKESLDDVPF